MIKVLSLITLGTLAFSADKISVSFFGTDHNGDVNLNDKSGITYDEMESVKIEKIENQYVVNIKFNPSGSDKNKQFTKKNEGKSVAFVINNAVISRPIVRTPSDDSVVLSFNKEMLENVKVIVK